MGTSLSSFPFLLWSIVFLSQLSGDAPRDGFLLSVGFIEIDIHHHPSGRAELPSETLRTVDE